MITASRFTGIDLHIGISGTFDIENYGDLLFPLIAEAELAQRLGQLTLRRFSYHRKEPPDWPYTVTSLTELPASACSLDGMLIGGGHIIRFDKWVAWGYEPPAPNIHHPTGYWLTPILIALQNGIPVAWNAPGVHGNIPAWAWPLMEMAINGSLYVSVRDEPSRQALTRFADSAEINVVPDTAFGVARLLDPRQPSPTFQRLRDDLRLKRPYVVVQANADLEVFARFARKHPQLLQGYQLVVLPTGPILGDDDAIFGDDLPGLVRPTTWLNPLALAELIRHASGVAAISLHLSITALALGVPLFRPAGAFGGKHAILASHDGVFQFDDGAGIDPLRFAAEPGRTAPSPTVRSAVRQLERHWDRVSEVFLAAGEAPSIRQKISRFWQKMPGILETHATARDELEEREQRIAALHASTSWKLTAPLRSFGVLRRRRRRGET